LDAIDNFHENIQKIDRKYPVPPTPLDQDTFAVKSITEEERKKGVGEIPMQVNRIVSNIETPNPTDAEAFYENVFGLELVMDHGWIRTYSSGVEMPVQVSIASEGGSGTPVPDLSIEVDDLETALARIRNANIKVEYGPVSEPWGVRRFYVRDPFGKLVNVLQHE